jgi:hypothetical protein
MKIGLIPVISERKLKPSEKKKLIGLEKDVPETPFTKKYGKKKGKQIYYATLTKQAKKKKKSKSMKEEKTMKVKIETHKNKQMEEGHDETEEISDFRPKISRNLADVPETGEEEMEDDAPDEEEKLGGGLPMKSAEEMAFEKRFGDMDPEMQGRFLARLAQKAKDKQAAKIALSAELNREERAAQKEKERAGFASLPGAKPPMEEASAALAESKKTPYPVLFEQRERLLKEAYQTREERVYAELVRRFIKK